MFAEIASLYDDQQIEPYEKLLAQYDQLSSEAKNRQELKSQYLKIAEMARVAIDQEIPLGLQFYFYYLFQPFRMGIRLFISTGIYPSEPLAEFFIKYDEHLMKLLSIDSLRARRYLRQVLYISFVTLLIPVFAALNWERRTNVFWVLCVSILTVILIGLVMGRVRVVPKFALLTILIAIITWANYTFVFNGFYNPIPFGLLLILIAVMTHLAASPRIIAIFTTVSVALGSILLVSKGVNSYVVFGAIAVIAGIVWHSADTIVGEKGVGGWRWRWRSVISAFKFMSLLLMAVSIALAFDFIRVRGLTEKMLDKTYQTIFLPMLFGFQIGYYRIIDTIAINLYQFALYQIEKHFRKTTIHLSPVIYHDSHFSNYPLIRHLLYSYKHEPELARKVLNACIMAPESNVRLQVLKKLRPDAFLSFNSKYRSEARQLAKLLKQEGLSIWYDEMELMLGRDDWRKDIDDAIKYSKSAVILVGKEGYGPFQQQEVDACLRENDERQLPVIPVILPEVELLDERLTQFTFVDLRKQLPASLFENYTLQRLKSGITGRKF